MWTFANQPSGNLEPYVLEDIPEKKLQVICSASTA